MKRAPKIFNERRNLIIDYEIPQSFRVEQIVEPIFVFKTMNILHVFLLLIQNKRKFLHL
jgi:hypothetical protein